MMRLPYHRTPLDFVPEVLRRERDLDLAEAIFGFTKSTGAGKARAYASRVFVADAILEPGQTNIWATPEPIVPKILASPKPTTFQHYLVQPHPDPKKQGSKDVKELVDYTDPAQSAIRGHKLYWHKGAISIEDVQEADSVLKDIEKKGNNDTQHTLMRPVARGVRFRWQIHFENLSDVELGALLWALTLPGEQGKTYRHSIGMGKPFGMGAIKIEASLILNDRRQRCATLFDDSNSAWQTGYIPADDRIVSFVSTFDGFIRKQIGATAAMSLSQLERIQMLLRMLEWPGPDKESTRYMEIERQDPMGKRNKLNEYKNRPVLPDPLGVEPVQGVGVKSVPSPKSGRTAVSAQGNRPAAPSKSDQQAMPLSNPSSIGEVKPGMYLEGRVVRVEKDRVVIGILGHEASLVRERIVPLPEDFADMKERFPIGKMVQVWVVGFNKNNRLQLTQKQP